MRPVMWPAAVARTTTGTSVGTPHAAYVPFASVAALVPHQAVGARRPLSPSHLDERVRQRCSRVDVAHGTEENAGRCWGGPGTEPSTERGRRWRGQTHLRRLRLDNHHRDGSGAEAQRI